MKAAKESRTGGLFLNTWRLQHPFTTTIIGRGILLSLLPSSITPLSFRNNNNNCLSGVIRLGAAAERFPTDVFIAAARASKGRARRVFFVRFHLHFFRSVNCTPPRLANAVAVAG